MFSVVLLLAYWIVIFYTIVPDLQYFLYFDIST